FTAPNLTYNGSEKNYTASAAGVSGFSYQYIGVSGTAYSGGSKAPVNVGNYQVTAIPTDGNYTGSASQTFAITAATLPSVIFTAPISGLTYNGNAKNYSASASGVSSLSYQYVGIKETVYPSSSSAPVNVGSYVLTVTSSDPNYVGTFSQEFSIVAQTVLPTVTFQFPETGLTYSASPKAFAASAPGVSGFSRSYVGLSPTDYPESATPPTQVGTYRVTATSTDKNYIGSASQVFTITGANLTPGAITLNYPVSLTYDGTVKSFTASSQGVSGFSYSYAGRNTTIYGPSTTAPFKAGEYKVTATSTDPNYVGSQDANFAISKATPLVAPKPTASGINLGQALSSSTLSGGVATFSGNTVPGSFAFANATETLSSTADRPVIFTPTDTVNYNTISTTVTVTVNQPPTLNGISVSGTEDTTFAFSKNIFAGAFSDPEGTALASVTVQSLPSQGSLKLGAAYVTQGQVIAASQLDALTYVPVENDNTASGQKRMFTVTASDGALSSRTATVEIGLDPVNDAPT
ncbi:MAG: hypothetical protein EBU36_07465, partial [Verrucomicrobia bacterium]|nr:hypothetical protein [Verrucomicrobiota bacterium]